MKRTTRSGAKPSRRRGVALPLLLLAAWSAACSNDEGPAATPEPDAVNDGSPSDPSDADATEDITPGADADTPPPPPEPLRIPLFERARITSEQGEPNFQNVRTSFTIPEGVYADARLVVRLESSCYPFEEWTRPPAGHRWPSDCDAFDRNFEFTLNDPTSDGDPPAFELVRAITPFGGPMTFDVDMTDFANALPGEHRLRAHITTWGDGAGQVSGERGGWWVSADLELVEGPAPREVLALVPLFNGSWHHDTVFDPIPFTIPEGTTNAVIEYRVTGHGGAEPDRFVCVGPAEEFCRRPHSVAIDDRLVLQTDPWRDDCDQLCTLVQEPFEHCAENPCGALSSVRAPRANWCPGDVTPPIVIDAAVLREPGPHTFETLIEDVKAGGSWRVSATLRAWREPGATE